MFLYPFRVQQLSEVVDRIVTEEGIKCAVNTSNQTSSSKETLKLYKTHFVGCTDELAQRNPNFDYHRNSVVNIDKIDHCVILYFGAYNFPGLDGPIPFMLQEYSNQKAMFYL